jgi:predicted AAA+ superfamily ATPase
MKSIYIRHLDDPIRAHFTKRREILVLLGSRQTGKTTLVKRLFPDAQYLLVDNEPVRRMLESYDVNVYRSALKSGTTKLIIDEIHLVSNPGRAAKIIYDQLPIQLILTGSSSFHIKNRTAESLTGRKIIYYLFPLTFSEYLVQTGVEETLNFDLFQRIVQDSWSESYRLFDKGSMLSRVLLYGLYPNLVNNPMDVDYLKNFAESLVFKDILELELIENKRLAADLLKMLAYRVGSLISYAELATSLGADQRTIKRYIELFEQSFLIFRLYPFTGNRRDEIVKSPKIYYYDTGVRNAVIGDFSELGIRPDRGALFENFIIAECVKANAYTGSGYTLRYWRSKQKSEVDLVLTKGNRVIGVEIKYGKASFSQAFMRRYPGATCKVVTAENFY